MNLLTNLYVKIGLAALILLLTSVFLLDFHHKAYVAGKNHELLSLQKQIDAQNAKNIALAAALKAATDKKVENIQLSTQKQLDVVYVDRLVFQKAAAEAAHANPVYAAERRPAAFERLRHQSLDLVTAAASRSAAAASSSTAGVPSPGS